MRRGLRSLATWSLLAIGLLIGPAAGGTLCFGDDGHVQIERIVGAGCAGGSGAAAHAPGTGVSARAHGAADCCGPCTDVESLSLVESSRRAEQPMQLAPAAVSCVRPGSHAPRPVVARGRVARKDVLALRDRSVLPLVLRC